MKDKVRLVCVTLPGEGGKERGEGGRGWGWVLSPSTTGLWTPARGVYSPREGRARLVSPAQKDGCAQGGPACSTAFVQVGVGGVTGETDLAGDLARPLCSRPRAPELSEQPDRLASCPHEPSPSGWRGLGSSGAAGG